ncbi:MAG: hypothetical protein CVU51_06755 [Deltaproteobacteria bacterium HGW-Deltaproteobacteria-1]|nr:MAG: hypothetical protein CVU51_06755 [Deltaproteobacteria bacterium HGW-Deltaproteobacteria-1]
MNTNKSKIIFRYINIAIAILTGILALVLAWDFIDFIKNQEGYYRLFGKGTSLGCNYQSAKNYMIFAATGTISMLVAFTIGFFFKDNRWAICARLCCVALVYVIEYILSVQLC